MTNDTPKEWNPEYKIEEPLEADTSGGYDNRGYSINTKTNSVRVGSGSYSYRVDEQGLYLGSEQFESAPFRVDMKGNAAAVGDVIMGNEGIGQYAKWDKSEAKFIVNGTNLALTTIYGDGSDGDVTISANTTITRDMFYNNLTINSGKILSCGGYRIFVKGTLTNNGTISANGGNGGNGLHTRSGSYNTPGGTAGAAQATGSIYGGTNGVVGAIGKRSSVGGVTGTTGINTTKAIVGNGVIGGAGGGVAGDYGGGGPAGTNTGTIYNTPYQFIGAYLMCDFNPALDFIKSAAGSGSGGGGLSTTEYSPGSGGGSGATAGICWIAAKTIINNGTISAIGGDGGIGGGSYDQDAAHYETSGGGGGGGDGGVILLIYSQLTNTGTITAAGGVGGAHGTRSAYERPVSTDGANGTAGKIIYVQY